MDPPITAAGEEPDPDDEASTSTGRTVPAGALVIAIMVAAALGILAIVALTVGGSSDDGEVDAARLAAGRFGERFLTFEHDDLGDWKAGVLSLSTGGFAREVDDVEEGLQRLVTEAELDVTARVTEIFIGQVDDGQISAVLLYDRELRSAAETRSESDRYMQVRLLRVDGEWLVDDVIDIATAAEPTGSAADAPAPESPAGATSSTSAPAG